MGDYNPHIPHIVGNEWVGIRDEATVFSPVVNIVEAGHTFRTPQSYVVNEGRFYVHDMPVNVGAAVYLMGVYPSGYEDKSGPVHTVTIPVESIIVTAATLSSGSGAYAMLTPSFTNYYILDTDQPESSLTFSFNTNPYVVLNGKRILDVSVLLGTYRIFGTDTRDNGPYVYLTDSTAAFSGIVYGDGNDVLEFQLPTKPYTVSFGEVNRLWQSPATSEILPWTWADIQRFDPATGGTKLYVKYVTGSNFGAPANGIVYVWYAALQVTYCEEQRVIIGGFYRAGNPDDLRYGANPMPLRSIARAANPTLSEGNWTVTVSAANQGTIEGTVGGYPSLNAVRQLERIPSHKGVELNLTRTEGEAFALREVDILPQLSIHTVSGVVPQMHVYGRIAKAEVYSTIRAEQMIYDEVTGSPSYPWARFYARRFGEQTGQLDFLGIGGATGFGSITAENFDALDEIVDGWKEVTLRLDPVATFTDSRPEYRFNSSNTDKGSRWEILSVVAPPISGMPGDLFFQAPTTQDIRVGTYQPYEGTTVDLNWFPHGVASNFVSSMTDDPATDAVLYFSQAVPTVTGVSIELLSQAITGFTECGRGPCCIPTGISYHRITWGLPVLTTIMLDTFTRSSSGFGTNDTGQTYTDSGGTVPGNYVVNGTQGTHILDGVANVRRTSVIAGSWADSHQKMTSSINVVPSGASIRSGIFGHYVDASNFDYVEFRFGTSLDMELVIGNMVAGTATNRTNVHLSKHAPGQQWYCVADFSGPTIRAKAWPVGTDEPDEYQANGPAAFTVGGVGLHSIRSTGNTNTDAVVTYDDYSVGPSDWMFGSYELQRYDSVEAEWKTIMLATSPTITGFNDYEARVGVQSDYRIRQLNVLRFESDWSTTVSNTLTEPGIALPSCGESKRGVLIFTSNESQSGAYNLAYAMTWDGTPNENFSFNEVDGVSISQQHDRDYQVAFHGTERGGESFSRTLLLANAAVALPRLANIKNLREMAWADLPYVCVRDDIGDRWLATVIVPSNDVRRNRRLYNANITVIEVTDTPSPVDP